MTARKETTDRICENAVDAIGWTPLVYLNRVTAGLDAKIAVKLEYMNPACSVKDRPAANMILTAQEKGLITPGKTTLIEGTSGNMGIGMSMAAVALGYRIIFVMPSSMSLERRVLLRAFGSEFVLTDPADGFKGVMDRVWALQKLIPDSFVLNQFSNEANIDAHYKSTGPEIWRQTEGKVDVVVFGVGSGGTMSGVGTYLKEKKPSVKVYAMEPFESSVLNGLEPTGPHLIWGTGAGIKTDNTRDIYEEALRVKSEDAVEMAKRLAREEGLLAGVSGGGNVCAAIELAKRPELKGKLIVTSLADFGERYLSTCLYSDIVDECKKLDKSTIEEDIKALGLVSSLTGDLESKVKLATE